MLVRDCSISSTDLQYDGYVLPQMPMGKAGTISFTPLTFACRCYNIGLLWAALSKDRGDFDLRVRPGQRTISAL